MNFGLIKLNDVGESKVNELAKHFETLTAIIEAMVTTAGERKAILAKMQEAFSIACRGLSYQKAYQPEGE